MLATRRASQSHATILATHPPPPYTTHKAFEKSDAQERWGSENVFQAMMGGRSLRFTAESVYGQAAQALAMEEPNEETAQANENAAAWARGDTSVVAGVGGAAAWVSLTAALAKKRGGRG